MLKLLTEASTLALSLDFWHLIGVILLLASHPPGQAVEELQEEGGVGGHLWVARKVSAGRCPATDWVELEQEQEQVPDIHHVDREPWGVMSS